MNDPLNVKVDQCLHSSMYLHGLLRYNFTVCLSVDDIDMTCICNSKACSLAERV